QGTSPSGMPEAWKSSTRGEMLERWAEVESEQMKFVSGLTAERLNGVIDYRNTQGQPFSNLLGDLMRHVVNHSTYHRGQVATMLRQLGEAAVSTDLVLFYRERASVETAVTR
ncbi:MAG: DinB family protein, partial [Longimicrobiales bacterium]